MNRTRAGKLRISVVRLFVSLFALGALLLVSASAQTAVSNATLSTESLNKRIPEVFGPEAGIRASSDVDLLEIRYPSTNVSGRKVTLTGLLALPQSGAANGLVVFNHGTTADRDRSPSRYKGAPDGSETELAILAFTSGGYAVAFPDYLGLGDEKSFHPYPLGAVNARAAVDIIGAARAEAVHQRNKIAPGIFVTGYSEGGAVAMWAAREIERDGRTLTASAPLAGPYDLSKTTRRWLIATGVKQEGFVARLYLMSYMVYSFHKNKGVKLTSYFKPAMAITVSEAFKTNRSDKEIITRLAIAAALMRPNNRIENVIAPRFFRALRNRDLRDPVVKELSLNDSYEWTPRAPLLLVNLATDEIVDPDNSDVAYRELRRRAGSRVTRFVIRDGNLNHLTAAAPSILRAREYFDGLQQR